MIAPPRPIPSDWIIDVSHWQGVIDWEAVAAAGVKKAGIKLTDGRNFGDPLGAFNARSAREHGIVPVFYHFLRPASGIAEQVAVFAAALYGARWSISDNEPIALDVESSGGLIQVRMRAAVVAAVKQAMMQTLALPEVYTRMSFWKPWVGRVDWQALGIPTPPLWAADYGPSGIGSPLTAPRGIPGSGWLGWRRWQYTDKGRVPGISASVDLNVESKT